MTAPAILVTVEAALGSTPREAGAWMVVGEAGIEGTIGGGALEHRAMERAREMLAEGVERADLSLPLGPTLDQCCGGHATLRLRRLTPALRADLDARLADERAGLPLVMLYGAGHVGKAVAAALGPLPCRVSWLDGRAEMFPATLPANAERRVAGDLPAVAAGAPGGAFHLVMTHSHPLDLAVCGAVLRGPRFAWLGLIGSATKRARFESRLKAAGIESQNLARLVCPIGIGGIEGKEPAVIAASVAAQLLMAFEARKKRQGLETDGRHGHATA
ncbi:MAG: xanthine dehydrogenase accessory protein XdhC [Geminicoccaceae bacterium]|nr:xanthine dehydrogenase accessory protein XdhC [Geminicoccaceae bacterium]